MPVRIDFARLSLPRIKNETVIGIIGKTQGVSIAAKPAKADININNQRVCPFSLFNPATGSTLFSDDFTECCVLP